MAAAWLAAAGGGRLAFCGAGTSTYSVARLAVSGSAATAVSATMARPASRRPLLGLVSMDANLLCKVRGRSSAPAKSSARPDAALAIARACICKRSKWVRECSQCSQ